MQLKSGENGILKENREGRVGFVFYWLEEIFRQNYWGEKRVSVGFKKKKANNWNGAFWKVYFVCFYLIEVFKAQYLIVYLQVSDFCSVID